MKKYLNPNIPKPTPGANEGDGTVKIPRQPRPTTPSPRKRPVEGSPRKRTVAGNKEGRASEFYKASRPIDFLMNMFPAIPGKPEKVKVPTSGGRVIGPVKKKPIKPRGAR
jgi:hypothetical protein